MRCRDGPQSTLTLIIGSLATLAAVGGETCEKGKEPLIQRITARGWVSLACLVLAFALGTAKEMLTSTRERQKDKDAQTATAEAEKKHQVELTDSTKQINDQQIALADAQGDVRTANTSLDSVKKLPGFTQKTLRTTSEDLNLESEANLVSSLTNQKLKIFSIEVYRRRTRHDHFPSPAQALASVRSVWAGNMTSERERTERFVITDIPGV